MCGICYSKWIERPSHLNFPMQLSQNENFGAEPFSKIICEFLISFTWIGKDWGSGPECNLEGKASLKI